MTTPLSGEPIELVFENARGVRMRVRTWRTPLSPDMLLYPGCQRVGAMEFFLHKTDRVWCVASVLNTHIFDFWVNDVWLVHDPREDFQKLGTTLHWPYDQGTLVHLRVGDVLKVKNKFLQDRFMSHELHDRTFRVCAHSLFFLVGGNVDETRDRADAEAEVDQHGLPPLVCDP